MTRGDQYTGGIRRLQRVHCILYGGNDGIVSQITGPQDPDSVKRIGGVIAMGGRAEFLVQFDNHQSHIPECIIRGVQWFISDEYASEEELSELQAKQWAHDQCRKAEETAKEENRQTERQTLPGLYPYLETAQGSKKSGHALGSSNIRKHLARTFPGVAFRVRSKSYSGGSSISVSWTDGPTSEEVKKVTGLYEECTFDGMQDLQEYVDTQFPRIFGGAHYVFEDREVSPEKLDAVAREMGYTAQYDPKSGDFTGLDYETTRYIRNEAFSRTF